MEDLAIRDKVMALETAMRQREDVMIGDCCPLKHSFAEGLYVREITVPAGLLSVTKIHKYSHVTVLLKGTILVYEESGPKKIEAPALFITPAMTKRAIYHVTEVVLTTIHSNPDNEEDIDQIEERVIAKSFDEDGTIEVKAVEDKACLG